MVYLVPKEKTLFCALILLYFAHAGSPQVSNDQGGGFGQDFTWPVTLTFHETKTNSMLGEALLKRIYARIGFSDNIIRAEVDNLFERLKEVIEKRLRKCQRKRRSGALRTVNLESMYGYHNNTHSQRNRKQGYPY